jgi:hypothetical protein
MHGRDWLEKSTATRGGNRHIVRLSCGISIRQTDLLSLFCAIGMAFNTVAAEGATGQGVPLPHRLF